MTALGQVYPVGCAARWDTAQDERALAALAALPKPAVRLLDIGRAAGWHWLAGWGADTGDDPFVTMHLRAADGESGEIRATWHTRDTGSPRLFSMLVRGRSGGWRHMSLGKAIDAIEETERP